jgi:hypothetical protein
MKYPCIMRDQHSGLYFVAGETGPMSGRHHRSYWRAVLELLTGWQASLGAAAYMKTVGALSPASTSMATTVPVSPRLTSA